MKAKLTKLERLFGESDYGTSSASGSLSKMLRGFWRDIGLTHLHINQLIDAWLEEPCNEYEQDVTKINNARGNIRKDNEKDDFTWKLFLRNLRLLRPQEVRFLIRLKFRNGATYRQVATMRPRSTDKYNSDKMFEEIPWTSIDNDGFIRCVSSDYDDEGFHKDEEGFFPINAIVVNNVSDGLWYTTPEDITDYISSMQELTPTDIKVSELNEIVTNTTLKQWGDEMANNLKAVANADVNVPCVLYRGELVVRGQHTVIRANLMGLHTLPVISIDSLPKLRFKAKIRV